MKSFLFTLVFTLTCCLTAAAQNKACTLKLSQAPEIRGLRLGMEIKQVLSFLPQLDIKPADEFGYSHTSFSFSQMTDEELKRLKFDRKGISYIGLDFLDGKLISLLVAYDDTVRWASLDEFVSKLNASFNLPGAWQSNDSDKGLTCDGFEIRASLAGNTGSLSLFDITSERALMARKAEKREKQKQAFRP